MTLTLSELLTELRQHYAYTEAPAMGFGKSPALLVVDFIEGFTSGESPLGGEWDEAVRNTAALMEDVRAHSIPVLFTTVEFSEGEKRTNLLGLKTPRIAVLGKGSKWTDVDHRLEMREEDIVISKKYGSAFFGTSLASQLQVLGVDTLLITGCVTSGCVRASAVDAAQHGFRPMVVREAVADRSILAQEANLIDIQQRYGDVVSLEEAREYLQQLTSTV